MFFTTPRLTSGDRFLGRRPPLAFEPVGRGAVDGGRVALRYHVDTPCGAVVWWCHEVLRDVSEVTTVRFHQKVWCIFPFPKPQNKF